MFLHEIDLLRGSLPEGVRQLSITYDLRLLK